jgi:superfamily II DNA or RNA helicase
VVVCCLRFSKHRYENARRFVPDPGGTSRASRHGVSSNQLPLHTGETVRIRDQRWRVTRYLPHQASAILEVAGCERANRGARSAFLLPCERVDRVPPDAVRPRVVSLAAWRNVARRALAESSPHWSSLRTACRANFTIIPFQLEPALALTRGTGCRFLIADEVGLGKTVQAGLMLAELFARNPDVRAVVVSPAGLRDQWCAELQLRFGLDAKVFDAMTVARRAAQLPIDINPWLAHPLIVTSIDYIKRPDVMRSLEALIWDAVVFDEAHRLAGHSDRAAAAGALAARGRNVVMLTATPHSGDDEAFGRLCDTGSLAGGFPILLFRRTRADIGMSASRRSSLLRVRPSDAESAMHAELTDYARLVWRQPRDDASSAARLAMIVLGRRACSSASSLARSVERRLRLLAGSTAGSVQLPLPLLSDFGDAEPDLDLAAPGLRDELDERRRLEHILQLAQAAARAETKIAALVRLVRRTNEPVIVFTEYRDTLERLALALPIESVQLHGGLSPADRSRAIRQFNTGPARLFLATDAAGEGLNLHHRCRLVVSLELPWTPLRLEQRAGRVDRLGQARRVLAMHLVAAGTSEESVLAKLARRAKRAKAALTHEPSARAPGEIEVADCIFGDRSLPAAAPEATSRLPPNILRPDLRAEAEDEAARILSARRLDVAEQGVSPPLRPVVAARRDWRRSPATRVWAFRLFFEDPDGRTIWEPLTGAQLCGIDRRRRSASALRAWMAASDGILAEKLADAESGLLAGLQRILTAPVDLMIEREQAIARRLRHQHARMAADMVQHGLFDRRTERAAAAQSVLLEKALAQVGERLHMLGSLKSVRARGYELVFGIDLI